MNSIDFDTIPCPKCGSLSKNYIEDESPVTKKKMYSIKCNVCDWETEKYFVLVMAELYWVDERNVQ